MRSGYTKVGRGKAASRKFDQLVSTAENLFMRHGIRRITVEEICLKAGVSKMTFYKYFRNKSDLIRHILTSWFDDWFRKLNEVSAQECSFPEKVGKMLKYKLELAEKLSPEFVDDFYHINPELQTFMDAWYKAAYGRLREFFCKAQEEGHIRPNIKPEFLMYFTDRLNEMFGDKVLVNLYANYGELTREMFNLLYYGILSKPDDSESS